MKRKRQVPGQIIKKLRIAEEALAGGNSVEQASRTSECVECDMRAIWPEALIKEM